MKQSITTVLALLLAAAMLAGCGGGSQSSSTVSTASSAASSVASAADPSAAPTEAGGLPLVPETVTYNMAARLSPNWGSPENGEFWQQMEAETNIHIEWTTFLESESDEKYSLLMASGDYPDAFIGGLGGGDSNIITYGNQVYIPLNDLINQYAPNFLARGQADNPEILNMITTPDGNIYGMPSILYNPMIYNNGFINKTWLDQLGLEVPTTTDEFTEVLRKFKDMDPNGNGTADEIPFTFMFKDWGAADHGPYFGAFGYPLSVDYTIVDSDKVVYLGQADSFKQGAAWMAGLYAEGLMDMEVFTQDDSQYSAKAANDPMTVGVFNSWDSTTAGANRDSYVPLLPLKGPGGEANWLREFVTGFYRDQFMITTAAENPEILMQWVDQFYRDVETSLNATMGIGPDPAKTWFYNDSGDIEFVETPPEAYERGQHQLPFAPAIIGEEGKKGLSSSGNGLIKAQITESYDPYVTKFTGGAWKRWPNPFMTVDEKEEIATLESDLITYSKNQLARWISGEGNVDDEWDAYLKELENIGVGRWLELKQQVYDRYMGK